MAAAAGNVPPPPKIYLVESSIPEGGELREQYVIQGGGIRDLHVIFSSANRAAAAWCKEAVVNHNRPKKRKGPLVISVTTIPGGSIMCAERGRILVRRGNSCKTIDRFREKEFVKTFTLERVREEVLARFANGVVLEGVEAEDEAEDEAIGIVEAAAGDLDAVRTDGEVVDVVKDEQEVLEVGNAGGEQGALHVAATLEDLASELLPDMMIPPISARPQGWDVNSRNKRALMFECIRGHIVREMGLQIVRQG